MEVIVLYELISTSDYYKFVKKKNVGIIINFNVFFFDSKYSVQSLK